MAKKYQTVETKIHWLTWTIISVIVVSLTVLTIALQPSAKDVFYDSYLATTQDADFEKKLPKDNKFQLVDKLDNGFLGLGEGLFKLAERNDHLSIVFFGDSSDAASVTAITQTYARLYGANQTSPVIRSSALYDALGDDKMSLYHYGVKADKVSDLMNQITEKFESKDSISAMPTVVVFLGGEIIGYATLTEANLSVQLYNFYNTILENKNVQLLTKN